MEFRLYAEFGESWITDEKDRVYGTYDGLQEGEYIPVGDEFTCNEPLSPSSFLFISGGVHFEKGYAGFLDILKSTYDKYEAEESTESMFSAEDEKTSFINDCVPNNLSNDTLIQKETKVSENANKGGRPRSTEETLKIDMDIYTEVRLYTSTQLRNELGMNHSSIKKGLHVLEYNNKYILKKDILDYISNKLNHE